MCLHLSPVIAVVIVDVDIVVVDVVSAKKYDIGRAAGFVSSFSLSQRCNQVGRWWYRDKWKGF